MTWPMKRLRYLATFNPPVPSSVRTDAEGDYPLLPMDSINEFTETGAPEVRPVGDLLNGYSYLEPTDVAYAKVTPCFENGKGLIGSVLDGPTFATTEITVLRPHYSVNQRFLGYLLQSSAFRHAAIASMTGAGGLKRVSETAMRDLRVPAPPLEEQRLIADYLDRETAEIDAFIADLLRARKLLGYRLKSIADEAIHAALPKVDQSRKGRYGTPDHPFGNDWIPLGALAAVGTGSLDTQDASENGIFPFFVRSDNIELSESATHHGEAVLTAGDGAGVGKVFHHYVGYFAVHQRVYVIEPGPKLEGRFLYWTLRTYFGDIVLAGTAKSTVESLRRPMLTGFPIPSLPFAEQRRIAEALDRANDEISEQLADAQKAIDLAQERRSALITVAVTGQIDVTKQGVSAAEQLRDELEVHV